MNPSEGLDKITTDLFCQDELGAVIRSHIRVESALSSFLCKSVLKPEFLKLLRLDYDQSVSLALVLGLDKDYEKPLRALGNLRNKFAHEPDMDLSKGTINNLYSVLGAEAKKNAQTIFLTLKKDNASMSHFQRFGDMPPPEQLKIIVTCIWSQTHRAVMLLGTEKDA